MDDYKGRVLEAFKGQNVAYSDFLLRQFIRKECIIIKVVSLEKCSQDALLRLVREEVIESEYYEDSDNDDLNLIKSFHTHTRMAWRNNSQIWIIAGHDLCLYYDLKSFLKYLGIDFETGKKLKDRTS
jgi:hypothetical protein